MEKVSRNRLVVAIISVMLLAALISCGKSTSTPTPTPTPTPTSTSTPTSTPAPGIVITSPTGNIFGLDGVTVSVQVSNFTLVDKLGQPNVPGEGHIHYFMDVDPPTTPGQPAVTAPGTYAATTATSYKWSNVGSGNHKFAVELVNNNHTPLSPPVTAFINVLVIPEIGPASLVILSPQDGAVVPGGNITVLVQVSNFNLADKLGQPNVQREGHIHYFLDVDAPTTPGQPAVTAAGTYAATAATSYTWSSVTSGTHTFSAELVNNDHTPLSPPVVARVTVTAHASTITPTAAPPTVTPTPTSTPGQSITINLTAQNIKFDMSTIAVPAGASVTVNFNNKDSGTPHNFAVYQNLTGGSTKPIFVGQTITGPATTTYHFTAPTASGSYFFECDVHPQTMNGPFIVTP